METRTCPRPDCEQSNPQPVDPDHWYFKNGRRSRSECKACTKRERNKRYADDPEYSSDIHLKRTYNITLVERNRRLEAAGGCECCGATEHKGRGWTIDHDHRCCPPGKSCGKCIRGVLCHPCNMVITKHFLENREAINAYAEKFKEWPPADI